MTNEGVSFTRDSHVIPRRFRCELCEVADFGGGVCNGKIRP